MPLFLVRVFKTEKPLFPEPAPGTGQEKDKETATLSDPTGEMHYRARAYSPRQMRFVQMDPPVKRRAEGQYVYAHNLPVSRIDTDGMQDSGPTQSELEAIAKEYDIDLNYWRLGEAADYDKYAGTGMAMVRGKHKGRILVWMSRKIINPTTQLNNQQTLKKQGEVIDANAQDARDKNPIVVEGMTIKDIEALPLEQRALLSMRNPGMFGRGGMYDIFTDDERIEVSHIIAKGLTKAVGYYLLKTTLEGATAGALSGWSRLNELKKGAQKAKEIYDRAKAVRRFQKQDLDELAKLEELLRAESKAAGIGDPVAAAEAGRLVVAAEKSARVLIGRANKLLTSKNPAKSAVRDMIEELTSKRSALEEARRSASDKAQYDRWMQEITEVVDKLIDLAR